MSLYVVILGMNAAEEAARRLRGDVEGSELQRYSCIDAADMPVELPVTILLFTLLGPAAEADDVGDPTCVTQYLPLSSFEQTTVLRGESK